MYVVLAGGGKIGRYIARDLVEKGHDVTVIEREPGRCEQLVATTSVLVIEGDACDVRYLDQARLSRADAFVATTHDDDDNLVSCQLAKIEFGVERAIARVNSPKNVDIFRHMGIEPVSSTVLLSQVLENEFASDLVHLTTLHGGRASIIEVRLPDAESPDAPPERVVADLGLPHDAVLCAIFRGPEIIIPRGSTVIRPGDQIVALTTPEIETELEHLLLGIDG